MDLRNEEERLKLLCCSETAPKPSSWPDSAIAEPVLEMPARSGENRGNVTYNSPQVILTCRACKLQTSSISSAITRAFTQLTSDGHKVLVVVLGKPCAAYC